MADGNQEIQTPRTTLETVAIHPKSSSETTVSIAPVKKDDAQPDAARQLTDVRTELQSTQDPPPRQEVSGPDDETKAAKFAFAEKKGFKLSKRFSEAQIEREGTEVIECLDKAFPEYYLKDRLAGFEKNIIIATASSLGNYEFRDMTNPPPKIAKHLPPWRSAPGTFFPADKYTVINEELPQYLRKKVLYHELLHAATINNLGSKLNLSLIEGATEYYASQAFKNENFRDRFNSLSVWQNRVEKVLFGLIVKAVGPEISAAAFFNGQVDPFKAAIDAKWGEGAFVRLNKSKNPFSAINALTFAAKRVFSTRKQANTPTEIK